MTPPILVAYLLAGFGIISVLLAIIVLRGISADKRALANWSPSSASQLSSRCYDRLRSDVASGQPTSIVEAVEAVREANRSWMHGVVQYVSTASVYLGLLGTLLGLQQAVSHVAGLGSAKTPEELDRFSSVAVVMLSGFGSAFLAAIAGVLVTLILSVFMAWIDSGEDSLYNKLEQVASQKMVPSLIREQVAPQDALTKSTELLALTLATANTEFEKSIRQFAAFSDRADGIVGQGTETLTQVAAQFEIAREGFSGALAEGTEALKEATATMIVSMTDSAERAAERLAAEVHSADFGHDRLEAATSSLSVAIQGVPQAIEALEGAVNRAVGFEDAAVESQSALRSLASAQMELGNRVYDGLVMAQHPLLDELQKQAQQMSRAFANLEEALKAHESFVLNLGDAVRDLPSTLQTEELALVGDESLAKTTTSIAKFSETLDNLRGAMLDASESTLRKIEALESKLNGLQANSGAPSAFSPNGDLVGQIRVIERQLNEIRAELFRPKGVQSILSKMRK